jgi:hypothetical protein
LKKKKTKKLVIQIINFEDEEKKKIREKSLYKINLLELEISRVTSENLIINEKFEKEKNITKNLMEKEKIFEKKLKKNYETQRSLILLREIISHFDKNVVFPLTNAHCK